MQPGGFRGLCAWFSFAPSLMKRPEGERQADSLAPQAHPPPPRSALPGGGRYTAGVPFLLLVAAYLIGSIPFGLLLGRWVHGVDLRELGSGNIGATNAGRVLGKPVGTTVLLLDVLKGLAPTLAARLLVEPDWPLALGWPTLCGLAAVLGHIFPVWLGFKGGKGVATGLGVAIVLGPWAIAAGLVMFVLTTAISGYVALGSMLAAVTYAAVQGWLLREQWTQPDAWPLAAFTFGVPLLIVWAHRTNIARLRAGTEGKSWRRGVIEHDAVKTAEPDAVTTAET